MERARRYAQKALDLDPELGIAHTTMAMIRVSGDWDFAGAEEQFRLGLDLDPGSAHGHLQYGLLLSYLGRIPEAIGQMKTARDLDPLATPGGTNLGFLYELNGEPERALAAWTRRETLAPSQLSTYATHGDYLCRTGHEQEALALLTRAGVSDLPWHASKLAYCQAISGRTDAALAILAQLAARAEREYVSPLALARVHVGLGQTDEAFAALERAYELRAPGIVGLRRDPHWRALYDDPRYDDLLRRIGFPES